MAIPLYVSLTTTCKACFRRMLPHAPKHGIRLITMNSRTYRGSTPYTDAELAELHNPDISVQTGAIRSYAQEMVRFLTFVCTQLKVPPVKNDHGRKLGGVVLGTWSLSGMALVSILGDPRTLDDDQKRLLSQYWRRAIFYGLRQLIFALCTLC